MQHAHDIDSYARRPSAEILYKGNNSAVIRIFSEKYNSVVVKKKHLDEYPSLRESNKFMKEVRMGQKLAHSEYIIKYYAKEGTGRDETIVMEDFAAVSIETAISKYGAFSLDTFLNLALKILDAVSWVHQHKLFHGSLSTQHILWNEQTNTVKLIDFGLCSDLVKDNIGLAQQLDHGSIVFKSPEQTGRMNREVDYRTDLYSLGVVFYTMLTGQLPFQETFSLDLIYAIIARPPPPISHFIPDIPKELSEIIMHLLEKNVENRYQSIFGVQRDLQQFMSDPTKFKLGKFDICSTLHISQKLYGRSKELGVLLSSFEKVATGAVPCVIVLVGGFSGVGKTALINEVHKPLVRRHGYFVSGKFDQFKRSNVPYSSFISAFQQLVTTILTESAESIQYWKDKLTIVLEGRGQIIVDVIPELAIIIGPQSQVPTLGAEEHATRFKNTFLSFVNVFAQKEHPLTIFLDDLQWADYSTLSLLEMLITSKTSYLLVFGAYRDNEVTQDHELVSTMERIERKHCPVDRISLKPLDPNSILSLVSDTLGRKDEQVQDLARIIHKKTDGNPFYMITFLKSLVDDDLISFDFENGKWEFNTQKIEINSQTTENVIDMMTSQLQKLSLSTQTALSLASCLGNQFDYDLLQLIYNTIENKQGNECAEALWPVIREGLLIQVGQRPHENKWLNREDLDATLIDKNRLQFLHDRVQQAAYELVAPEQQEIIHISIGRLLLRTLTKDEIDDQLFDIISHFRIAKNLLNAKEECFKLANYCIRATQKAQLSNANHLGVGHAQFGIDLLTQSCDTTMWVDDGIYSVTLSLYKELCTCLYMTERYAEASELYPYIEKRTKSLLDTIDVQSIKAKQFEVQGKNLETVEIIASLLRMLGIDLPYGNKEKAKQVLIEAFKEVEINLQGREIHDLINSPQMTDRKYILAMKLLNTAHPSSFVMGEMEVYTLISVTMVNLSIKYGNSEMSPVGFGYYGLCSSDHTKNYHAAFEFAKLSVELANRTNSTWKGRVLLYYAAGPSCYFRSFKNCLETLRHALEKSFEYCDYANVIYTYEYLPIVHSQFDDLNNVFNTHQICSNYLEKNNDFFYNVTRLSCTWLEYLWTPEASMSLVKSLVKHHNPTIVPTAETPMHFSVYHIGKLFTAFFKREKHNFVHLADECDKYLLSGLQHLIFVPIALFFIAATYLCATFHSTEEKARCVKRAEEIMSQFEIWASWNPENFKHRYLILLAQHHAVHGRVMAAARTFEQAATCASIYSVPLIQAIAYELAAEMWSEAGYKNAEYRDCVASAFYCYNSAGAVGKVDAFKRTYGNRMLPQINVSLPRVVISLGEYLSQKSEVKSMEESFDVMAVTMATKAMSGELSLEQFLSRMMRITIQYAGATRGVYIQKNDRGDSDELTVVAEGSVDNIQVDVLRIIPLQEYEAVPKSLVNYVMRVKESVVIGTSSPQTHFFKEFSQSGKSALCFPVIRNGECKGVLYLENNTTDDAFSGQHAEIMQLLTGHISMSLENARLATVLESERRLKTTTLQLEQAKKRLEEFIDILCHELRNPLNVICVSTQKNLTIQGNNEFFSDIVLKMIDDFNLRDIIEFKKLLHSTEMAYEQLKEIIDTVLTVSMLENKSVTLQNEVFDPRNIVSQVADMFLEKAVDKNITLDQDIQLSEKTLCVGDPTRLQEVLINLVSNAIKFTGNDGGHVTVSCHEHEFLENKVTLYFSVEDTGCGLSSKDIERILSPNASSSSCRLGLRICKELCELMGGSLQIESTLGQGALFSFKLVLALGKQEKQTTPVNSPGLENAPRRILVADDNNINQKILCRLLGKRGYVCDVASNGLEALQMISIASYDVVLMDIEMPILSGIDAVKRVRDMESERQVKNHLPIIGVSAHSRGEYISKVLEAGMNGYVTKPYMSSEIYSTVEKLLKK